MLEQHQAAPALAVREMTSADMAAVLEIEATSGGEPWSWLQVEDGLTERNVVAFVAESGPDVVAHVVVKISADHFRLRRLAVHRSRRRRGAGRDLFLFVARNLSQAGRARMLADVPETNLGAQLFLRECGCRATAVEHGAGAAGEDLYRFGFRLEWPEAAVRNDRKGRYAPCAGV